MFNDNLFLYSSNCWEMLCEPIGRVFSSRYRKFSVFYCLCRLTVPTANAFGTRLITSPKNISLLNTQIFIRMYMYKCTHERTNIYRCMYIHYTCLDCHTFSGICAAQISIEICFALNKSQEVEIEVCFVLWLLELLLWHYLSKCV